MMAVCLPVNRWSTRIFCLSCQTFFTLVLPVIEFLKNFSKKSDFVFSIHFLVTQCFRGIASVAKLCLTSVSKTILQFTDGYAIGQLSFRYFYHYF